MPIALVGLMIIVLILAYNFVKQGRRPMEIIYYLDGQEIRRETATIRQLEKLQLLDGVSFLTRMASQEGLTRTGLSTEEELPNGGCKLTVPVRYRGEPAVFTIVMQAKSRSKD
mgnify:CR=1 FL=1